MCGITGVFSFNSKGDTYHQFVDNAVKKIHLRGPDRFGIFKHNNVSLGHTRLSIIDISDAANQPFTDASGRYTLVYNGEFFNYLEHKKDLLNKGFTFKSESDTEVLLYLFMAYGSDFISKINGFFACAIYDSYENRLFLYRDRYGIKPLYFYLDENVLLFSSEMKSLLAYGIPKEIDKASMFAYFQLNYIPAPDSIFENVKKITPGTYVCISTSNVESKKYYELTSHNGSSFDFSYEEAKIQFKKLLDNAVKLRLVSDVPLGAFLSGGIDSSVIVALASQYTSNLKTYSIGYKDEPMFDETYYANLVAAHFGTEHTVFSLSNDELLANLFDVLDYIDEPFADSSALAVHILSMHTKRHVTVALSGDGADEMLGGYNKHRAEFLVKKHVKLLRFLQVFSSLSNRLPQSRNQPLLNTIRQFNRLIKGAHLSNKERYWQWASISNENDIRALLKSGYKESAFYSRKNNLLEHISNDNYDINNVFYTDMKLVLQSDMLVKVDMMSMANSLEVRPPFLDYNVVDFCFSLPSAYKIDKKMRKKILQDSFRELLPNEIFSRKKHGFEVPLLKWFRNELKSYIFEELLHKDFVKQQNIFSFEEINNIKKQLLSSNPMDSAARIWALIVFQYWYKKYFS